jgi:hypothetical protein
VKVELRNPRIEKEPYGFSLVVDVGCGGKRGTVKVSSFFLGLEKLMHPAKDPKEILVDSLKFEVAQWLASRGLREAVPERAKDTIISWVKELKEIEV